jgi:hypothetical protein
MNKRLDYFRQVEAEAEVTCALDQLVVDRTVLQRFAKVLIPQNEASHGRYKGPIFPITAVVISHRLSTLGNVDEIIVLKDGRVAERGTFRELKRQGGLFSGFLAEQNRYNLDRTKSESIIRPTKMRWQENGDEATVIKRPQQPKPAYAQQARLCVETDGKVVGQYQLGDISPCLKGRGFPFSQTGFPASLGVASSSIRPSRSDTTSTGCNREPLGQNVLSSVDIPVVPDATLGADPFAHIKWEVFNHLFAIMTRFRRWIPTINLDEGSSIPLALILQLTDELTPISANLVGCEREKTNERRKRART